MYLFTRKSINNILSIFKKITQQSVISAIHHARRIIAAVVSNGVQSRENIVTDC